MKITFASAIISLSFITLTTANASPLICPFTDHFDITINYWNGDEDRDDIIIRSLESDGNVKVVAKNTSFDIKCKDSSSTATGHVHLVLEGTRYGQTCSMTIKDGPYEWNPTVAKGQDCDFSTQRMHFYGLTHDFGTHNYHLHFYQSDEDIRKK